MFKRKQNQDPTLKEKTWTLYSMGRYASWTILVVGTLLTFMLATLLTNLLEIFLISLLDSNIGLLSGASMSQVADNFLTNLFNVKVFLVDSHILSALTVGSSDFFVNYGSILTNGFRWIIFGLAEYSVFRAFLNLYTKSRDHNNNEYGHDRIATPQEVAIQTNKVPDRKYMYDSPSGVIFMHKFNWRGKVNKAVKQQRNDIQKKYLKLTPNEMRGFSILAQGIVYVVIIALILGTLIDAIRPYNTIPFYSPFRLLVLLKNFVVWVWHFVEPLFHWIWILETNVFHLPIYVSVPVLLLEIGAVGYVLFNKIPDWFKNFNEGATVAISKNLYEKVKGLFKSHATKVKTVDKSIKENNNNSKTDKQNVVIVPNRKREGSSGPSNAKIKVIYPGSHIKRKNKGKTKISIVAMLNKFYQNPKLSFKLVALDILEKVFPLEQGVTGYYYMTDKQQNVLIYGISRSGKGEMVVNETIELNSRSAVQQKNMITNDAKGELAAGSYVTLRKRGYDVKILNIMNMSHSMSYNPLNMVIKHAQTGDMGQAGTVCSELSYTIYDPDTKGENAYFYTSAANLFDAAVFGLLALVHGEYYGGKDEHPELSIDGISDKHSWDKVTIANILQMTSQLGGEAADTGDQQEGSNRLIVFFTHLSHKLQELRDTYNERPLDDIENDQFQLLDQAVQKFQQSKMAGSKTAGNIYSTFLEGLRIYQQPEVARMTSMNNFDIEELGFDRLLTVQFHRAFKLQQVEAEIIKAEKSEDGFKIGNIVQEKSITQLSEIGLAKIPIDKSIENNHFFVRLTVHDERINRDFQWVIQCEKIYYSYEDVKEMKKNFREAPIVADIDLTEDGLALDHYTHEKVLHEIKMDVIDKPNGYEFSENYIGKSELNILENDKMYESLRESQLHFLYNEKPTALFLVTPPNRVELNQLCTFIINQTFNTLSDLALRITNSKKIQRPLQLVLDELGNLPAIPKLDTKISIGLSQGIEFMLVFQDREQAVSIYKKEVTDIIISNCATTYYILSKSEATIKEVSDGFGERTAITTQLNHDPTKITSANYNDSGMSQKVMPTGDLRHLKIGEAAILRTNDRSTSWGQDQQPLPIFDTGNYILPYAWWFLSQEFIYGVSLNSLPVVTPHKYLDLESITYSFHKVYMYMEKEESLDESYVHEVEQRVLGKINDAKIPAGAIKSISDDLKEASQTGRTKYLQALIEIEDELADTRFEGLDKLSEVLQTSIFMLQKMQNSKSLAIALGELTDEANYRFDKLGSYVYWILKAYYPEENSLNLDNIGQQLDIDTALVGAVTTTEASDFDDDIEHQLNETGIGKSALIAVNHQITKYLADVGLIQIVNDEDGEFLNICASDKGTFFLTHFDSINAEYLEKYGFESEKQSQLDFTVYLQYLIRTLENTLITELEDDRANLEIEICRPYSGLILFKNLIDNDNIHQLLTDKETNMSYEVTLYVIESYVFSRIDNLITFCDAQNENIDIELQGGMIKLSEAYNELQRSLITIDNGLPLLQE
jgi:type IV secretory pathway TraG/TraD family ATPase VirD4